jgi:hypothetical protein
MKKKNEFSKSLLIWETILIWVITLSFIGLAYICIINQYFGELTWLGTIYAFPWAAYGVSQACYYKKAEKENTKGGIKYDSVMSSISDAASALKEAVKDQASSDEAVG